MIGERTGPARRKESGPALEGTPARTTLPEHPTTTDDSPAPLGVVTALPLRWAKALIDAATGPIPQYGSPEWDELPDDAREKVASCVMSAERDRTRSYFTPEVWTFSSRRTREIAEAQAPRPGDHVGGAVEW